MSTSHEVKAACIAALGDPKRLVTALGLDREAQPQSSGFLVLCPWHGEKEPSCSVTKAPNGRGLRVRCHACGATGDALSLIAAVRSLDRRGKGFIDVLREACDIAGLHVERAKLDEPLPEKPAKRAAPKKRHLEPLPPLEELPPVAFPPASELKLLWDTSVPLREADGEAQAYVRSRGLDPTTCPGRVIGRPMGELDARRMGGALGDVVQSLAGRVALGTTVLPRWARWRGKRDESISWSESGHRIVLPVFDCDGQWRSVRAIQVDARHAPDAPKRLPPGGYSAVGLVLATPAAVNMLRGAHAPERIIIVEGEPDFLTWASRGSEHAVLGVFSGSWSGQFAKKIQDGATVVLRVHRDDAGDKYAAEVARTLANREVRLLRA